ncbi:helix-turn-helix domain-containing protein [Salmonella enterica subsp. enterica serovar 4,[5],12:i:-]|jgi:HTH-type transcriptional regulator/antitoxin HipB|uniref:Helix-turn-helix domain-containing protein n=11 Tax=Gammaproteobacteria TaxID=1236 RepID=A0A2R4KL74_ECOLX|nr:MULTISPECIES: helix-turn-helix domain-containing protein [Gammaproteobacteria]AZT48824.1 helix-turn-helix domain-containing protein [Salmonella enterica subsp. enterica serovar Mikawasima]EAA9556484.1 helix-turn-helix domain-containing protein [Salmonella enterica subsp. enterica serovar Montevideo]EAU5125972.1 helix-turn-helix domain-containing protein [Salmonella enterica subsp. enterica serovar Infantis]EBB4011830.1 helix-turn-helix domain-containing protein [Salmonella enterica subsp. en
MKVTSPSLLAAAVRDQRKLSKLTQSEAAKQVGIKQTTVSDFELRPESTKLETLFKLLSALDLELHVVKRGSTLDDSKVWDREW